ncbi:tripartite tricarboxylate transporter TctB family protein [Neisseria animalis]|uniref:Tripartite tricarboxylate transporter TctB family protein n=1 Tax=Neisseria animalis TaxID=492 RepID=A0A5P3MQB5_NEIAN|nr:tripartite tricarboxylate transporter TctB family protein [Neisseria animalis]QEY23754.1 tripartite tricarboxylate transporter TctB family protein [Neisseria animalis]ROW32896.1 tripartite tricarboxylate transporter TctB family protein [Neisseria animalis]VEE09633.1 Tripartite tricarboxylate transporter TctB family [Neisseria animalis]
MNLERYFSGLLFTAAIFLLYLAWGYTAPIAYDPLGPRPYPVLLLSLLAVCCLYLAVRPIRETVDLGYTPPLLKKLGICLLALLMYGVVFELLGFPLATAAMAFVVGKLFGGSPFASAISGIVLGVGLYLLFDILLDVPLPVGTFG